jgi:hypothetical protein
MGQITAVQRPGAINRQLRSSLACGEGDEPLFKPVKAAIVVSKFRGIWQMLV